jgi:hypothetical protein
MALKSVLAAMLAGLMVTTAGAQSPVVLKSDDVYFQYRPITKNTVVPLCGYTIRGNHYSHADRHVEWDLNVDELLLGKERVVGISAGTFDVVGRQRSRMGRSPIAAMEFIIAGDPQSIAVHIVGAPNQDNAIRAVLETEVGTKLLTAFAEGDLIAIDLKYADASADTLQVRNRPDLDRMGPNSYFSRCLKHDTPELRNPKLVK